MTSSYADVHQAIIPEVKSSTFATNGAQLGVCARFLENGHGKAPYQPYTARTGFPLSPGCGFWILDEAGEDDRKLVAVRNFFDDGDATLPLGRKPLTGLHDIVNLVAHVQPFV